MSTSDCQHGASVGLMAGGALRAAVEIQMPGFFPQGTGYGVGGPHRLRHGESADDTSMALALPRPEKKEDRRAMLELWQGHS